jgi:hypothetical protein
MRNKPRPENKKNLYGRVFLAAIFLAGGMYLATGNSTSLLDITGILGPKNPSPSKQLIVQNSLTTSNDALFDVVLNIPEQFKSLLPGNDLLISLSLTEIEKIGPTDVIINYIITSVRDGKVVLLDHESRLVETHDEFLKSLATGNLSSGKYNLMVEMLYSDTWAASSAEFFVTP